MHSGEPGSGYTVFCNQSWRHRQEKKSRDAVWVFRTSSLPSMAPKLDFLIFFPLVLLSLQCGYLTLLKSCLDKSFFLLKQSVDEFYVILSCHYFNFHLHFLLARSWSFPSLCSWSTLRSVILEYDITFTVFKFVLYFSFLPQIQDCEILEEFH